MDRIERLRHAIRWLDDAYAGEYGGKGDSDEDIEKNVCYELQPGDMTDPIVPPKELVWVTGFDQNGDPHIETHDGRAMTIPIDMALRRLQDDFFRENTKSIIIECPHDFADWDLCPDCSH